MRRNRNAKIIATLGPASSDRATIRALFEAGADVFRLNFSHGGHADHQARYEAIRAVEQEMGRPIGILADLQGPKLRIGTFAGGPITLETGRPFRLDLDPAPGNAVRVRLPHPEIFAALHTGAELLLDDGKIRLAIECCGPEFAETQVVVGGRLSERKGVNVPGVVLPLSALTEKDRKDLDFALQLGVGWVALSFVQRPEDLDEVRELARGRTRLVAKLEKPAAVERLEAIVERADALMIARGDLGVEPPPERVPTVQRQALRACRAAGKPAIVATQMLESMIEAPTPTRAEASDVATAVYEGADAVMLSAESAAGRHPVEAVRIMDRIVAEVERDPHYRKVVDAAHPEPGATIADAICCALRRGRPRFCRSPPPSPTRARAPRRSAPRASGRRHRSWRSLPTPSRPGGWPWSGACMRYWSPRSRPCARWSTAPAPRHSRRDSATWATSSRSRPECRFAPPAIPTCCGSHASSRRSTQERRRSHDSSERRGGAGRSGSPPA